MLEATATSQTLIIPLAKPPYNSNPEDPQVKEVQGV